MPEPDTAAIRAHTPEPDPPEPPAEPPGPPGPPIGDPPPNPYETPHS
jgi:hypothetical protein